jgi:predicted RNA-binding Zn-ribbon protein involved in translation (DUF1610 family)
MSNPEIARRCPSCGVSIREAAFFCPQCGVELPQPRSFERSNPFMAPNLEDTITETAQSVAVPEVESRPEPPREHTDDPPRESVGQPTAPLKQDTAKEVAMKVPAVEPAKASAGQTARGAVGAKLHRATTLARDVEGDVIHRVQRVREMSSVVLDEAGYDPSLRFVLVAAVLFILFLVMVLLNKVIT